MPLKTPGGGDSGKNENSEADDRYTAMGPLKPCLSAFAQLSSSMTELGACGAFVTEGEADSHKGKDCVADESHGDGAIVAVLDGIA